MNLRPRRRTSPTIPIVTLVDILTVVLLFFVATTTFTKKKSKAAQFKVNLPSSAALGDAASTKETRISLSIANNNKIYLDGKETEADKLSAALKDLKDKTPRAKLELQADEKAPFGLVVKVWDALKNAGYSVGDVPARLQRSAEGK